MKKLDRILFTLLGAAAVLAFFVLAYRNWVPAGLSAAAFLALAFTAVRIHKKSRDGKLSAKEKRRRALQWLNGLAFLEDGRAFAQIKPLIPEYNFKNAAANRGSLRWLPLYPEGNPIEADRLLTEWRPFRDEEELLIVTTGRFDEQAVSLADTLATPRVRLIDQAELVRRHIACGSPSLPADPSAQIKRPKKKRVFGALKTITRKRAPRNALYGALMLVIYLIVGIDTYLAYALFLLLWAGLGIRRPAVLSAGSKI